MLELAVVGVDVIVNIEVILINGRSLCDIAPCTVVAQPVIASDHPPEEDGLPGMHGFR